jgi:hypothetical protein
MKQSLKPKPEFRVKKNESSYVMALLFQANEKNFQTNNIQSGIYKTKG